MAERRIQMVALILMMLPCLATACSANKMAREVAGETLDVVTAYEKQVDKKVGGRKGILPSPSGQYRKSHA